MEKDSLNNELGGFKRTERLNEQIREEIADILRTRVKDPRVGFVTITSVHVSADLRYAKILITVLDSKDSDGRKSLEGLGKAASFIRGELGRRLHIRYIPHLSFQLDHKTDEVEKVLKLLDDIRGEDPDRT